VIALLWGNLFDALCWLIILPVVIALGYRCLSRSEDPKMLIFKWVASAVLLLAILGMVARHWVAAPLFVAIPAVFLGLLWTPSIGAFLVKPFTDSLHGGTEEVEPKPFYYVAEAHRRKGLFEQAAAEVRQQLEKFPGDVPGHMMLATMQAEDMHDMAAARATLEELLAAPDLAPQATVTALYTLADWQLQFGRDPEAARASLERIVGLFPHTQFSHAAEQRIAHLAGAGETRHQREHAKFQVRERERNIGLRPPVQAEPEKIDANALAGEYVKQLEAHPADTDTREKLAVLYAEQFHRLDLAADQLEQLIAVPEETPKHVAHWLNLMATLHIKLARDEESAEKAVRRIIEKFPNSGLAEVAAARLAALHQELKEGVMPQAKRLGIYDKDIGLKSN
jgi:outer membrane protein assembly factor BamD (BamD/ComL family)